MSAMQKVYILWDASHIWGLMAWRAVRALGVCCRLVKAQEIAEGALLRKPGEQQTSPLLLVPGGSARLKASALGARGREAIRNWVASGGRYLGFCGGAGLALSHKDPQLGLNLCPWARASYRHRLQHLISGHVMATSLEETGQSSGPLPSLPRRGEKSSLALPVWWPGRFAAKADEGVAILASYGTPGSDFWIADLPLQRIPQRILDSWQNLYGVNLSADFLEDQPLVISGKYGQGAYVLSYSHLETPHSPDANAWFAHLLHCAGLEPRRHSIPLWQLRRPHPRLPDCRYGTALMHALEQVRSLLDLAVEHHLFFARTHWLWGWKTGLPGASCNNLHSALHTAVGLPPSQASLAWWIQKETQFEQLMKLFTASAEDYLLACRLAGTLSTLVPDAVGQHSLNIRRQDIFGHHMNGGGLLGQLLHIVEELIYLSQDAVPEDLII